MSELQALVTLERQRGHEFLLPCYMEEVDSEIIDMLLGDKEPVRFRPPDRRSLEDMVRRIGEIRSASSNLIFVSHSSKDEELAKSLKELLEASLDIRDYRFRITSLTEASLQPAQGIDNTLRSEVRSAELLIGIITNSSINSTMTMFEMGARWGLGEPMRIVFAGSVSLSDKRPINSEVMTNCAVAGEIHNLIKDIGRLLGVSTRDPAQYVRKVEALVEAASKTP